jgi:uncharacterized protein
MPSVLPKATVSAIFLDETQRLNPPEQGTVGNFFEASLSVKRYPIKRSLSASVRVPPRYYEFVETLLKEPNNLFYLDKLKELWSDDYIFEVCDSAEELVERLSKLKEPSSRVAMVAAFTESPGHSSVNHPDNLRIGHPLTSGFSLYKNSNLSLRWLMTTSQYRQFWIGGSSNNLEKVASIYGSQGFESDYVGVIWGRDLVFNGTTWSLGDPNVSYDSIDRLITGRPGNRRWNSEALALLINRYRIFLTRGIRGTFIFCEDKETIRYFKEVFNKTTV